MNMFKTKAVAALRDQGGAISVSIPELIASMTVRIVVIGGVVAAIGGMLLFSATSQASTTNSASFQATDLRFQADVAAADFVRGSGSSAVTLLNADAGQCQITTYTNAVISGVPSLTVEKSTQPGACSLTTVAPAGAMRTALLGSVDTNIITYNNVGGRAITFNAAGVVTLAAGPAPAGVSAEDWADTRPYRVSLAYGTTNAKTTTFAKKAVLVGFTSVLSFTQAAPDPTIDPPSLNPPPAPAAVSKPAVRRSAIAGALYSNFREGIQVSFSGGNCWDTRTASASPTKYEIRWTATAPIAIAPVLYSNTAVLGATTIADFGGVPNGSTGEVSLALTCDLSATSVPVPVDQTAYTQPVPSTIISIANTAKAEDHDVSWTAVSSLPTVFDVGRSGNSPALVWGFIANDLPDLKITSKQADGTAYGYWTFFDLTPKVYGMAGVRVSKGLTVDWPTPSAPSLTANTTDKDKAAWSWNTTCPAGTTGQYRTTYWANDIADPNRTRPWSAATAKLSQSLDTRFQGFTYQMKAQGYCKADLTPSTGPWSAENWGASYLRTVEDPTDLTFSSSKQGSTIIWMEPSAKCGLGADIYQKGIPASFDMYWLDGPRVNQTGWWADTGWMAEGYGLQTLGVERKKGIQAGWQYQLRVEMYCVNKATGVRSSGTLGGESQVFVW